MLKKMEYHGLQRDIYDNLLPKLLPKVYGEGIKTKIARSLFGKPSSSK